MTAWHISILDLTAKLLSIIARRYLALKHFSLADNKRRDRTLRGSAASILVSRSAESKRGGRVYAYIVLLPQISSFPEIRAVKLSRSLFRGGRRIRARQPGRLGRV